MLGLFFTIYPPGVYTQGMDADYKQRTKHRAAIIKGQIEGLQRMIESDEYCMDILAQSLAIQRSVASLNKVVIQNYITEHAAGMMASGDAWQQQKATLELLNLYELNNVRGK
jgi:DNA-binding FrmR family transcriptional regulator